MEVFSPAIVIYMGIGVSLLATLLLVALGQSFSYTLYFAGSTGSYSKQRCSRRSLWLHQIFFVRLQIYTNVSATPRLWPWCWSFWATLHMCHYWHHIGYGLSEIMLTSSALAFYGSLVNPPRSGIVMGHQWWWAGWRRHGLTNSLLLLHDQAVMTTGTGCWTYLETRPTLRIGWDRHC